MKRTNMRLGALAGAAALSLLSIAPAHAATVSQAGATALKGAIAGNPVDIASVLATNNGTGESKSGASHPPISVLQNQALANIGVLAQDATARVLPNGDGNSAACAGVAGNGASVANVGESNCLTPGQPVGISVANLDLTGVQLIDPASALAPLDPLNQLGPVLGQITAPLTQALAPLADLGIRGTLGAVESRCVANPGSATGTANIVDTRLELTIPGQSPVVLAQLPVNPAPNTNVLLNLDQVVNEILNALRVNFQNALTGALDPLLQPVLDAIQPALVDTLLKQVADQLGPLNDNLARIILNKQDKPAADKITVTALSLELLPAAAQFTGGSLVDLKIGEVTCGPNGRYSAPADPEDPEEDEPKEPNKPNKPNLPDVPTTVASGVDGGGPGGSVNGPLALGALLTVVMSAGIVAFRRRLTA